MSNFHRKDHIILFIGDIIVLLTSLILTLIIRYGKFPTIDLINIHIAPFSILFIAFILVYFIAGLYEKHTSLFRNKLPVTLLNVQLVNTIVGISFFYFIPNFSIAPKFFLFLFLVISLILMYVWRIFFVYKFSSYKKAENNQRAILLADTSESIELEKEVNNNSRYDIKFIKNIKPSENSSDLIRVIKEDISKNEISIVVLDTNDKRVKDIIPSLYSMAINGVQFYDIGKIYENIFDRIPVSMIGHTWFIEHMSSMAPKLVYDGIKRIIDIIISSVLGLVSLIFYPFIIIAIKIEDDGGIFSYQDRVGQHNKTIRIVKFRTMTIANDDGKWGGSNNNKVTVVGAFLRKTRLDEIPQLWNVLRGDISLIGPRPEFRVPVEKYTEQIPFYTIRHSIKPGLSGWAQIYHEMHPHHGIDIAETANKLSYDLYYIKHRSLMLDLKIALRTVKVLITFVGR